MRQRSPDPEWIDMNTGGVEPVPVWLTGHQHHNDVLA
jgi:hypothetical protein